MKIMFLDESGDHSLEKIDKTYPIFVLAGCIFDFDYYNSVVEPSINKLKNDFFGKTNIILRSYNIRKQNGDFSSLVDKTKREKFYLSLNKLISELKFTIIASTINKLYLKNHYVKPNNPYHLCFQFIIERTIMFLGKSSDKIMMRIESRQEHNDRKLAEVYEEFRNSNHNFFKQEEIQRKITDLSFNQKSQNVAGMQIADLTAYPIGKWVLDRTRENKAFEIIKEKLHKKNGEFLNYGLKIFP